jgi:hypothetical protein
LQSVVLITKHENELIYHYEVYFLIQFISIWSLSPDFFVLSKSNYCSLLVQEPDSLNVSKIDHLSCTTARYVYIWNTITYYLEGQNKVGMNSSNMRLDGWGHHKKPRVYITSRNKPINYYTLWKW